MNKLMMTIAVMAAAWSTQAGTEPALTFPDAINVFTTADQVIFNRPGGKAATLEIKDGLGHVINTVPAAGIRVAIGQLTPGYYSVLENGVKQGCFVVTIPPQEYPNDRDSSLGVDFAMATASPLVGRPATLAMIERNVRLAQLAGVKRVRERLPLAAMLKREAGDKFAIKPWLTDHALACEQKAKLHVTVMFQSMPSSFCLDNNSRKAGKNLPEIERLFRFLGEKYRDSFDCWEIYNEIDLFNFYEGTAADYAAFFKAASLGLRQGAPRAGVALSSFARTSNALKNALATNAVMPYYDVFNFHTYADVESLFPFAQGVITGTPLAAGKEIWCTEAGTHVGNIDSSAQIDYDSATDDLISRQVVPVYTELLAAGVDRAYYFIWRFFPTLGSIVDKNYSATQRYAVLATANRMLGNARYRGTMPLKQVRVHLFETGKNSPPCLTAWSTDKVQSVKIDLRGRYELVAMTGETIKSGIASAPLEVKLTERPVFLRAEQFRDRFADLRVRPAAAPANAVPVPVVMDMKLNQPLNYDNALAAYETKPGQEISGKLNLTNFSHAQVSDRLLATSGQDWKLTLERPDFTAAPGATVTIPFTLHAPAKTQGKCLQTICFRGERSGATMAAAFSLDYQYLQPLKVKPVFAPTEKPQWVAEAYDHPTMNAKVDNGPGSLGRFTVDFTAPAKNRMFWPYIKTISGGRERLDFSGWDGIRFTLKIKSIRPGTWFMCTLTEENGAKYGSSRIVVDHPGSVKLLYVFSYFVYMYQNSAPDGPDFHLNTEAIKRIGLGFHTLKKYKENFQENYSVDYEITDIELVKY